MPAAKTAAKAKPKTAAGRGAKRVLELTRTFKAPRDKVFRAWTDPKLLQRWFGPETMTITRCKADAVNGGAWLMTMKGSDGSHTVSGTYVAVEPPQRLVFTWAWHESADPASPREHETVVTVEFAERNGETEMRFRQAEFRDAGGYQAHEHGWTSSFRALERQLAGAEPKTLA